ncbi:MAG: LacI family DNA-binding transcriptional regulator [bacterium]
MEGSLQLNGHKRRKITIYDIAMEIGISPTSVSFVLNGLAKQHRISDETAAKVISTAHRLGYAVNLKARGLRLSRSGLAGMILPHYRNRFFAGLAEAFETEARAHGLCPVVVSTQRDGAIEASVIETLLAQQVEFLFIAGVHDPDPLNVMCRKAGVASVNLDLPGREAPSVVSDNYGGAHALTEHVARKLRDRGDPVADIFFFGGLTEDDATAKRFQGFRDVLLTYGITLTDDMVDYCGYPPEMAAQSIARRYSQLGRLPRGLFVNGVTSLEGLLQFAVTLPAHALDDIAVGSFDWDPFAAHLSFEVTMVRQNVENMIAEAFKLLEIPAQGENPVVVVPTSFGRAGRGDGAGEDWRLNPVIAMSAPD